MPLQHFTLSADQPNVHSTYLSTLHFDDELLDHPQSYSVRNPGGTVRFHLFHGRPDPKHDMDDWGINGPTFDCLTVAHDPDRVLLQECDSRSLTLATKLGLEVYGDTVTIKYHDDLLEIPKYLCNGPMYFGDHSSYIERH